MNNKNVVIQNVPVALYIKYCNSPVVHIISISPTKTDKRDTKNVIVIRLRSVFI